MTELDKRIEEIGQKKGKPFLVSVGVGEPYIEVANPPLDEAISIIGELKDKLSDKECALRSIDSILQWMADDKAGYDAEELRQMAKKANQFKNEALA